jgi:hypothetical protein
MFSVASGTDRAKTGIPSATVTAMLVKGLIARDAIEKFALTDRGRVVLLRLRQGASAESARSLDSCLDRKDDARAQEGDRARELLAKVDEALDQTMAVRR